MKCRRPSILLGLLSACILQTVAQEQPKLINEPDYNKKKVFTDLPQKMRFKVSDLESLLTLPVGTSVNTLVAANFRVIGKVVSKSDLTDAQVQSVVVKLTNREGAILTFTRTKNTDGTVAYLGRVFSRNNGDALEVVKENGQYAFVKRGLYDIFSE